VGITSIRHITKVKASMMRLILATNSFTPKKAIHHRGHTAAEPQPKDIYLAEPAEGTEIY